MLDVISRPYDVTWWHGNAFRIIGPLTEWPVKRRYRVVFVVSLNKLGTNNPVADGFRRLTIYVINCYKNDAFDNLHLLYYS